MIYLLHFDAPLLKNNGDEVWHYIGYCRDERVQVRVKEHQRGRARSKLTNEVHRRGIGLRLVRTWPEGGPALERYLKKTGNLARHCPICRPAFLQHERERQTLRRRRLGVPSAEQSSGRARGTGGRWLPRNPGSQASPGGTSPAPAFRESTTPSGRPDLVLLSGGRGSGVIVQRVLPIDTPSAGTEPRSG